MIMIFQMFFLCSMSNEPAQVDKDSSSKRQVILEWFVLHSAVEIRALKEKVILHKRKIFGLKKQGRRIPFLLMITSWKEPRMSRDPV